MTLGEWLSHAGVRTVTAATGVTPLAGVALLDAPDLATARLLAEADGLVGTGLGATWDGEVLTLVSTPVTDVGDGTVATTAWSLDEFAAVVSQARRAGAGSVSVRIAFDPAAPGPGSGIGPGTGTGTGTDEDERRNADPSLAAAVDAQPLDLTDGLVVDLVLAGRGVVRADAVDGLRQFCERTGLGVLNAFTAKGLFRWDSPFHLGTGILQERDLALAGAGPEATVLAVGLDIDECPPAALRAAGLTADTRLWSVAPDQLAAASTRVRRRPGASDGPPALYRELAAVVQPLYAVEDGPLNPARAAADVAAAVPDDGAVYVEPGLPGLWVGRALPTTRLGSARVPAAGGPGIAVAGALLHGLRGGPAVAVVDAPPMWGLVPGLLEWAGALGVTLVVEVWDERGGIRSAQDHRDRLAAVINTPGVHVIEVPVDFTTTRSLVDVAGEVVAWPGTDIKLP